MKLNQYEFQTRVSYEDVDADLHLTLHGAMRMMQEAAILHSCQSGYSILDIPQTHVLWMLVQWRVAMTGDASWNDRLVVRTWPRTMERITSSRDFELLHEDGSVIAKGESVWILVNADTGRAARITPEIAQAYPLVDRPVFDAPLKKPAEQAGVLTNCCRVRLRDLDTNHHVNNLVYLDYAREALPHVLQDCIFREVYVNYRKQLLLDQPVSCFYYQEEDRHVVRICGEDPAQLHAVVAFREMCRI